MHRRIAIFTPLPPVHSGISIAVETILPTLTKYFDCDLFIDDGYTPELSPDCHKVTIYRHFQFPERAENYDAVVYHLGNSQYHVYMVPYLRRYSGIVVLHDVNLHGMSLVWTLGNHDLEAYRQVLREEFQSDADAVIAELLKGKTVDQFQRVVNKYYVNGAKAVVVHNQYSLDMLRNEGVSHGKMLRLPVQMPTQSAQRDDSRFCFASFGYFSPHKHIDLAIRCIKRLVEHGLRDVRYHIVGHCESGYLQTLTALVDSLRLEAHVTLFGHVTKAEYQQHLQRADAAINLRYPTCGESSASLLDALSYGVPTIVSDIGSFREFPDGVVLKVPAVPDEDHLFAAMLRLYQERNLRIRMSRQAQQYVSQYHSVDKYVHQLSELIESVCK